MLSEKNTRATNMMDGPANDQRIRTGILPAMRSYLGTHLKRKRQPDDVLGRSVQGRDSTKPGSSQRPAETSLDTLIQANPKQALRDLEEVSTSEYPGLYPELRWYPPHQWAFHMIRSFEMDQLLIRIDWQRTDSVKELPPEELPLKILSRHPAA